MASNIPDPKKLLHFYLLSDLSEIIHPDWEGYDRFLMKLRGYGISPKEKSESEKSVSKLFDCLEARGLIDVGNYELLLKVLEGQNEPARKLIQEYKAKMDAVVSEDEEGPCKKRRIENDDSQPSCSYEQLNKATCTATLRVRSKPEERGLTRMDQQNNSNTFVQTQAVIKGKELLDKTGILIYTGLPGEGKTENALYIMNEWRREHPEAVYMMMDSVSEWDDVDPKVDSVIFLEDCLGKTNANTSVINNENKWKNIESCIDKGKVKLILTVRKHIYMRYRTKLENNKTKLFMKKNVIDLTSQEFFLTYENKKDILLKHCSNSNIEICVISQNENYKNAENVECKVKISCWTIRKIIGTNCVIGFPYTCYLFTCHPKYTKQGAKFFQKPLEVLKEIISELANTESKRLEKIQYGLMCYMMIKGGEIDLKSFDQKLWKKVFKSLAINSPSEREKLEAIDQLNHRYIIVENALLSFKHQTILECVALCFKDDNIPLLLQFCSEDFITEYVRPADFEDIGGEVFIKLNRKDYQYAAQRFSQFLQNKTYDCSWVDNPLMQDKEFIALFISIIKPKILLKSKDIIFVPKYEDLFIAACVYGKHHLLDSLYSEIRIDIGGTIADGCLRYASYRGVTDAVFWLLDHNIGLGSAVDAMEYASTDTLTAMMKHQNITLNHVKKALMSDYRFINCDDKTVKAMFNRWPDIDQNNVIKLYNKCLRFNNDKALGEIQTRKNFASQQILSRFLEIACVKGCIKVVELIVSRHSYTLTQQTMKDMFMLACAAGQIKSVEYLLNLKLTGIDMTSIHLIDNDAKITNLHIAAYFGRFNVLDKLIQLGLDVNGKCRSGKSVMSYAMLGYKYRMTSPETLEKSHISKQMRMEIHTLLQFFENDEGWYQSPIYDYSQTLNYLIPVISDIDLTDLVMVMDNHGGTLAQYCVANDQKRTIELLSNRYVKAISSKTSEKLTCLHIAAIFGSFDIFEMLVNKVNTGLSIKDRDLRGRSVLHYAMIGCKFASMRKIDWDFYKIFNSRRMFESYSDTSKGDYMRDDSDTITYNSDNIINRNDNDKLGDTTEKSSFDFESGDIVLEQGNKSSDITDESDGLCAIRPPFDCESGDIVIGQGNKSSDITYKIEILYDIRPLFDFGIGEKGNNGDIPNESMNDNGGAVVMTQDCERSDIVIRQRKNNSVITNESDGLGVIMPSYHCERSDIVNDEKDNNSGINYRSDDRLGDLRDRNDHILGERLNTVMDKMWDIQAESSLFQYCVHFPGFGDISEYSKILVNLLQNNDCNITDLDMVLDEDDCTLAHYCVVHNGISIIKTLCDVYPGLLSIQNRQKFKPIDLAVLLGRDKIFEMLYPISEQNHDELNRLLLQGRQYTDVRHFKYMTLNEGKKCEVRLLKELLCVLPNLQNSFCFGCSESYDVIHKIITKHRP